MEVKQLVDLYVSRGAADAEISQALDAVSRLADYLRHRNLSAETVSVDDMRSYIDYLREQGPLSRAELLAVARFFYVSKSHDVYIYFTQLFGSRGVMENISERLSETTGRQEAHRILDGFAPPSFGTPLSDMPARTADFMTRLQGNLSPQQCRRVLAGNNHGVSADHFMEERALYLASASLDQYLAEYHRRGVEELERHCAENRIWFEQVITPDVVDFVKADQEILSAVRRGDKLYVTKIPYDTVRLLQEQDPARRRYHVCHCPFVREALLADSEQVPGDWCYCSAGFVKFPFEVIFDTELEVELLESPLLGHDRCRFAITLPENLPVK